MAPLVLLLLAVEPAPVRLAAPAFSGAEADTARAAAWLDSFAQQLRRYDVTVVTEREMTAVLGPERQRELLACAETCTAELVGALDGDGLLLGSVATVEGTRFFNARVLSAAGAELAAASEAAASEAAAPQALAELAAAVASQLRGHFGAERFVAAPPDAVLKRRHALVPATLALALGMAGGIGLGVAAKTHGELRDGTGDYGSLASIDQAVSEARIWNQFGIAAVISAGVALAATMLIFLFTRGETW